MKYLCVNDSSANCGEPQETLQAAFESYEGNCGSEPFDNLTFYRVEEVKVIRCYVSSKSRDFSR